MTNSNTSAHPSTQMTLSFDLSLQQSKLVSTISSGSQSPQKVRLETPGRTCIDCHEIKPLNEFAIAITGTVTTHYKHVCKKCEGHRSKERTRIRKTAPPPPDNCQLCGVEAKLHLDHDHETGTFRGWLCTTCNTGLGKFNDSVERLQAAIDYLNETTN
jgi:hypothetical protein